MNPRPIGNRPLVIAAALRRVVQLISDVPTVYRWDKPQMCNCGLLARTITGMTSAELRAILDTMQRDTGVDIERCLATWKQQASTHCPLNPDLPVAGIFKLLVAAGLERDDFDHLERLTHPELRLDWKEKDAYGVRLNLIHYCNAWATKIEQYHATPSVQSYPTEAEMERTETRPLVRA